MVQCPKTMNNLSNFRCQPGFRVGKMWKWTISTIYQISNNVSIFVFRDMKYHMRLCSSHSAVIENNEPFKFTVSNSAQKAQFYKRSGNRQCRNGHNTCNRDDLVDLGPIITKFWSIMATSRYNCAIMNKNFVGIGPNSAITARYVHSVIEGLQSAC